MIPTRPAVTANAVDSNPRPGDFAALLETAGIPVASRVPDGNALDTCGTTVIAVKYQDGVLNVGDRRATAGNAVIYDEAEKVLPLDSHTLIAIAGSYARAINAVEYLRHSFKYYERSQLQPMSLEGKLHEVSRVVAGNLSSALQGFGGFIPVLSAFDTDAGEGRIFFYDGLGARFETREHGAAGSGSERIGGVFDYILRTIGPFRNMSLEEALRQCLLLLDIAADLDAMTGGYHKLLPVARVVTAAGVRDVTEAELRTAVDSLTKRE